VAKALLAKEILSARQIDKLVRKSLADVKPSSSTFVMDESEALRTALDKLASQSGKLT
jgi:hypothetical protein